MKVSKLTERYLLYLNGTSTKLNGPNSNFWLFLGNAFITRKLLGNENCHDTAIKIIVSLLIIQAAQFRYMAAV